MQHRKIENSDDVVLKDYEEFLRTAGYDDDEVQKAISIEKVKLEEQRKIKSDDNNSFFKLWEVNELSLNVFLSCLTQIRVAGMGGIIGLDYSAVMLVIKHKFQIRKKQIVKQVFSDIMSCESVALKYWNKSNGN